MIRSAAASAISVEIVNDEFVSMNVMSLMPRRSPILCTKTRKLCVIVRHGFVNGVIVFEHRLASIALPISSNDASPQSR
jgi:hypothetical protein